MSNSRLPFMLSAILAMTLGHGLAEDTLFDKYCKAPTETRWAIPTPTQPVAGNQNGWYVTPYDLRLGSFGHAAGKGKVSEVSDKAIVYVPNSVWGRYTWKLSPDGDAEGFAAWAGQFSTAKGFRFGGEVTEIGPNRKVFKARIAVKRDAAPSLPVTLEFLNVENEKRLPDVHSRLYGPHWRHTYDVYYPEGFDPKADEPLPVVMNIHGGGWGALDKQTSGDRWNKAGIAVISINYRYVGEFRQEPEMTVPVAAPLLDAARCLQDVKYNAKELGINPDRILLTGGSAGGATSAWLAMVDSLEDPDSDDPVARVSTRVHVSTPHQAQTSLDPKQMQEWIPGISYGSHAFMTNDDFPADVRKGPRKEEKERKFQYWLQNREKYQDAIKDFSAYEQASADDPPMMLVYGGRKDIPVDKGGNATHHPKFGEYLHKRLKELGVDSLYWCDNVPSGHKTYDKWVGVYFYTLHQLKGK